MFCKMALKDFLCITEGFLMNPVVLSWRGPPLPFAALPWFPSVFAIPTFLPPYKKSDQERENRNACLIPAPTPLGLHLMTLIPMTLLSLAKDLPPLLPASRPR